MPLCEVVDAPFDIQGVHHKCDRVIIKFNTHTHQFHKALLEIHKVAYQGVHCLLRFFHQATGAVSILRCHSVSGSE